MITGFWGIISAVVAGTITALIVGLAVSVLWALFSGKIDLTYLLAEPQDSSATAKASLSRFQFLVFTFVIAGTYLILCLESGAFVDMPQNVVLLLGVSGGTYAASKGIQTAGEVKKEQLADAIESKIQPASTLKAAKKTPS